MHEHGAVVRTGELFRPLHGALMHLLRGLRPGDWGRTIGTGQWTVRDAAAHLLDIARMLLHRLGPDQVMERMQSEGDRAWPRH